MWNGDIVINAIKIHRVIQILSVTLNDAFLKPKVAGVSCGHTLGVSIEPLLRGSGTRRPRCFLGWNLCQEHVENKTSHVGRKKEMNAPMLWQLDRIIMPEEWMLRRCNRKSFRRKSQRVACLIKLTQKHHRPKESKNSRKCQTENDECSLHITSRLTKKEATTDSRRESRQRSC